MYIRTYIHKYVCWFMWNIPIIIICVFTYDNLIIAFNVINFWLLVYEEIFLNMLLLNLLSVPDVCYICVCRYTVFFSQSNCSATYVYAYVRMCNSCLSGSQIDHLSRTSKTIGTRNI